jgi:prophage tail gpP-like protein
MVGKPTEQATLIINGTEYRDWETVLVRHALMEQPPYRFRFTCSEGMPLAKNWGVLQIKPGDECTILLAGQLAFTGKVSTRQVYYDKGRHYIEIQGGTFQLDLSGASPVTKTMEMKKVTFNQIAMQLLAPFGIPFKVEGGSIPQIKFDRVSLSHGLSVFDHLDLYSRAVGAQFTSDEQGSFVAHMGPTGGGDALVEGQNILIGREIIYDPSMATSVPTASQQTGGDQKWGAQVASVPFMTQDMQSLAKSYMPFVIPSELPTSDNQHLQQRGKTERDWMANDQITVFCTVYGWLQSSGQLWHRGDIYHVTSPMLIMDMGLKAKSVTFTQDNNEGTRTTLELCNENALTGMTPQAQ